MSGFGTRSAAFIVLLSVSAAAAAPAEIRTWTDASGKFKREASFQRLEGDSVVLKTAQGVELKVPLTRLSMADQAVARKAAADSDADPFEAMDSPTARSSMTVPEGAAPSGEIRVVVAKGVGATVEEAKKDAYREAVRQVVGAYVEGDTVIRNDELIEDRVLSLSGALVQKCDVIPESVVNRDSLVRLRVRAEVKVTEVMKSLAKINVTTTAVRTADLAAQVTTAADQATTAEAMLGDARLWEAFPASFFSMSVVGQPKVLKTRGDEATVELMLRMSPNTEAYLAFAKRLSAVLSKLGGPHGTFSVDGRNPDCDSEQSKQEGRKELWHHVLVQSYGRGNGADPEIAYAFPAKDREEFQNFFRGMGDQIAAKSGCLVYCFNQDAGRQPHGCGLRIVASEWGSAIGREPSGKMMVCLMVQANALFNRTKWEWFACDRSLFPTAGDSPWDRSIECEITICGSDGKEIVSEVLPLQEGFGVSRGDWNWCRNVMLGPMWIQPGGQTEYRFAYVPQLTFPRRVEVSAAEAASIAEVKCVVRPRMNSPE